MQKGEKVIIFRLSLPTTVHVVTKRCKNLIVLDDSSRWNADGSPQSDSLIDHRIVPWTQEHQSFLNESVTISSPNRIYRTMRVKKVLKEFLVLDYGAESNFSIKFSLKDGACAFDHYSWCDFKLSQESLEKYQNRSNDDGEN